MNADDPATLVELLRSMVRTGMDDHEWTQARLAEVTGLTDKHIHQLLSGRTDGSMAVWDRLLKAVSTVDDDGQGTDITPGKD